MRRAFDGLKVLDFSTTIAGPYCARLLADLGAMSSDRIPPTATYCAPSAVAQRREHRMGPAQRRQEEHRPRPEEAGGHRCGSPAGGAGGRAGENYRPGVMKRLGLDYPTLHAVNPRLVYCAMSAMGRRDQRRSRPTRRSFTRPPATISLTCPISPAVRVPILRRVPRRRGQRRLCLRRHFDRALPAREDRHWPADRRVDAGRSMLSLTVNELQWSQFEVEKAVAADVRAGRDGRTAS